MYIKSLGLKNFGKFHDKFIELTEGINVIYGENEQGKTTIHQFINGMLLGIDKTRKRNVIDVYTQYEPWEGGQQYEGTMLLSVRENTYRIKRSFSHKNKQLSITDERTGREIHKEKPIQLIEGLNESNYLNTISIGQLKSKTEESLATEVKSYVANLQDTKTTDIHVGSILDNLQGYRKRVDSKVKIEEISRLKQSVDQLKENEVLRDELLLSIATLIEQEQIIIGQEEQLIKQRDAYKSYEQYRLYVDVSILVDKKESFEAALTELEVLRDIALKEVEGLINLENTTYVIEKDMEDLLEEQRPIRVRLEALEVKIEENGYLIREPYFIEFDHYRIKVEKLQILENQLKENRVTKEEKEKKLVPDSSIKKNTYLTALNDYKQKSSSLYVKQGNALVGTGLTMVLGIVGILLLWFMNPTYFMYGSISIIIICGLIMAWLHKREAIRNESHASTIQTELNTLLEEHGCNHIDELNQRYEASIEEEARSKGLLEDIEALENKNQLIYQEISHLKQEVNDYLDLFNNTNQDDTLNSMENIKGYIHEAKEVLSEKSDLLEREMNSVGQLNKKETLLKEQRNQIRSWYEDKQLDVSMTLAQIKTKVIVYNEVKNNILQSELLIQAKLGKEDYEALANRFNTVSIEAPADIDITHVTSNLNHISEQRKTLIEMKAKLEGQLEQILSQINQGMSCLSDYEELQEKMKKRDIELEAIKLAAETIHELSASIHDDFGQELNQVVSNIIADITGNKYKQLRIDEKLQVKVDTGTDYVKLDALSCGTIDQIYFSLRMGVANLLFKGEALPFILDDAFAMYDDKRLRCLLQWLARHNDRQIIIFTCHHREKEILEELGINYNDITL